MRINEGPITPSPTAAEVRISGNRSVWVLPVQPDDPSRIDAAIKRALGARPDAEATPEDIAEKALTGYALLALVYDAGPVVLDTPAPEDPSALSDAEWLELARGVEAEMRSRTGRKLLSLGDVTSAVKGAVDALIGGVAAEKNG